MAALTQRRPLDVKVGSTADRPVLADAKIYQGGMVGIVDGSGYARPFTAGDRFAGHAEENADATGKSSGDLHVRCKRGEYFAEVAVTGAVITSVGLAVYASNDADLTMTDPGGGADKVGEVDAWISNGKAVVRFTPVLNA